MSGAPTPPGEPPGLLLDLLAEARRRGFLGPGRLEQQLKHSEEMARLGRAPEGRFLDLGSGGGLPGLVLAATYPSASGTLLDASERRTAWLQEAVQRLGWDDRVTIVRARAEEAARDRDLRVRFGLVVARSFGPPPVTAECARGFLAPGGTLVVSEPAVTTESRWDLTGLATLGLTFPELRRGVDATVAVMAAVGPPEDRWPRRLGIPAKRPLW